MPRFSIVTFGCQMNMHDTARMREGMERAGYVEAPGVEDADVILLNTCSVREKAEQKLRSEVGRLALLKRHRPGLVLGVTGCVAQQEGERLVSRMRDIDLVVGPDNIPEIPSMLRDIEQGTPALVRTVFDLDEPRFLTADPGASRHSGPTAFVTVMKGCDERCSFCIVPTTRGPERYRPAAEILDEIRTLVATGVREVTLLGQTVNSYRDPAGALGEAPAAPIAPARAARGAESGSEFSALLRAVADQCPGLVRLRYTSPHPRHVTGALVRAHRDLSLLPKHVHMPVQSGSDRVLKRMIRRYTVAEYEARMDAMRKAVPGLTLSTDVIVGFPGETEEDFDETLELVDRMGFVGVFGFKYSQRPGTPALKLEDDVSEAEKQTRLQALFARAEHHQSRHLAGLVGSRQRVLVEGRSKGGHYTGRSERNEIVHLDASSDPTGTLVDVRIVEAFKHSLAGEPIDPSLHVPYRREPRPRPRVALPVL